ncbi:MAG: NADPH-Fe(3+) oxidoreductase subunit alpha [bacterium]|nr:MAG: NADPH-Fe(3+) oxidoreductase subunit alpha [bacterium]
MPSKSSSNAAVDAPSAVRVEITLNGRKTTVAAGTTILEAARMNGLHIPTLCWLEKLQPIGACRVCAVEVEGVDSPVMSCVTPVAEGMNVKTKSEELNKYRADMIRFILVNHPLDCPVCERSGECHLQNLTYTFGIKEHVWKTAKYEKIPVKDWGLIRYDKNLCILCERCIKICREVQGVAAYQIDGNGFDSRVNTVTGEKLDCDFCGQCISICPVGALSSGIIFAARSWDMIKMKTVCPHCGVGCSFHLNIKKGIKVNAEGRIIRVTSDDAIGHNNGNLCVRGRFGYEFTHSVDRLATPLIRDGENHVAADWETALDLIAQKLSGYRSSHGNNAFGAIGSERATNEDNYVFGKFFREVLGSGDIDSMVNMLSPHTASGLFEVFGDFPMTCSIGKFRSANLFVFIGSNGSSENPVLSNHIRWAMMDHGAEAAAAFSRDAVFEPAPRIQLPYDYAAMHEFLISLLSGTVESINKDGAIIENSVPITDDWRAKLKEAASDARRKVDESLNLKIAEFIKLIRKQGSPVYIVGSEAQRHPSGKAIIRNIVNLAKLTGGSVMLTREYCNSRGAIDMGLAPDILPGCVPETRNELKSRGSLLSLMEEGKIKALIIADEDPLRRHPDRERFSTAMQKVEFVVVTDQFYSLTCREADVILPTTVSAEKSGSFTNLEGRIQRFDAVVKPPGKSRSVLEIFGELARRMGGDFQYENSGDVTAEISDKVTIYGQIGEDGGFADYSPLVNADSSLRWEEPAPIKNFFKGSTFLLLPDSTIFELSPYTDYCPTMREKLGLQGMDFTKGSKPPVCFNPADAEKMSLSEGDAVAFKNGGGKWEGVVRISMGVRSGSIRIPDDKNRFPRIKLVANGTEFDCINTEGLRR